MIATKMHTRATTAEAFDALRPVQDPELGYSIVDLGLVYDAAVSEEGTCTVRYTLTSPACPLGDVLEKNIRDVLATVPGVTRVNLELTFDPPWGPEKISESVKRELRLMGMAV